MRLIVVAIAFLSVGVSMAAQDRPQLIRVCLQFIEMPHPVLTELLAGKDTGGPVLHAKAVALSKEGKAKILETCIVLGRNRNKFTLESNREEIYPTENSLPGLPCGGKPVPEDKNGIRRFRTPTAFETRFTGVTLEVQPIIADDGKSIELQLAPEVVTPVGLNTLSEYRDQWGDASIRMPVYESWRVNTSLSLQSGKFELASSITPKPAAPVPAVLRKILVFVRADIVPVPTSP